MKCSKCGAECKDNQTFCMNCGSRLHLKDDPDSSMERELADSVGALLDEFDAEEEDDEIEDFLIPVDDSLFEDEEAKRIHKELQVDQIYSRSRKERQEEKEDWDYDEDKYFDDMQRAQEESLQEFEEETGEDLEPQEFEAENGTAKKKNGKNKKKKIMITTAVVAIVLLICIGGGMYILNNIHFNLTSYEDYYGIASREYKRADYKTSLKDCQSALRKAQRAYEVAGDDDNKKKSAVKQIVQVRELMNDVYEKTKKVDDEYADNLYAILELDDSKTEYFPKLARYYSENKPPKVLTDFLRTVKDDNKEAIKALKKYIVPVPECDQKSGQYTGQFAVTLTCKEGSTVWYTIDGQDPSTHGIQYTEPIKITNYRTLDDENIENGLTVLKAISVNANQVESKIVEFSYEIVMASGEPIVTPQSGHYSDYTPIQITVPEGSKCYYTIGEGSEKPADPDASSTLYIASADKLPEGTTEEEKKKFKPLQIPRGTHIMKFVLIDQYGIASDVAVRSYTLEIPRNVSLNEAEEMVKAAYEEELATNSETIQRETPAANPDGTSEISVEAKWEESVLLDEYEYYIIYAKEVQTQGENKTELSKMIYAVNSYDKKVIKDVTLEDGVYHIPIEEETGEGETDENGSTLAKTE